MIEVVKNNILTLPGDQNGLEEQTVSDKEREFVESIYRLFAQFKVLNIEYLDEIRVSRSIVRLKDELLDTTYPQLNTLNSTMDNIIADYVDNMPEVVLTPEVVDDDETAKQMTDVVGWVLHHARFPVMWKEAVTDATHTGTGIIEAFYDEDLVIGGVSGNIDLLSWPPESWLPDPMYDNFQDGRAIFKVCNHPMSYFVQHYPDKAQYVRPDGETQIDYLQDGRVDDGYNSDDPLVCLLEVWYRQYDADEKRYKIHMAKVAGGVLLEDSRKTRPDGVYGHGMYPFAVFRYRKRKGTTYGTGMCHEFADTQRMINRFMKYIDENIRLSSRFKMVISEQAGVDLDALTDMSKEIVPVKNRIGQEYMDWFQAKPLNSLTPTMMASLQDMMKQDSGQNQFSRGEGGLGVTAASAIGMLQSAGGKISRMHVQEFINDFGDMCDQIVSLIGEFFKEDRVIRIYGDNGVREARTAEFNNQKMFKGIEPYKKPAYSVRIQPQRSSPDQVQNFNQWVGKVLELAQNAGNPISPLAAFEMLQLPGKENIIPILEKYDAQRQMLVQLQQQVQQMAEQMQQMAQQNQALNETVGKYQNLMTVVGQQMKGKNAAPVKGAQPSQAAPAAPTNSVPMQAQSA